MKFINQLVLLGFLIQSTTACSQTNSKPQSNMEVENNSNKELQIIEITRQLTRLMIEKNTDAINKIVDANFTLTHITGYVQSKTEWFAEIESELMKYYSYQEVKTSVKITGDKATFVGQNLLDARKAST
ncbi:MAG: nuclear transport factor 2 family protein [Ferruginibacter sp.]